MLTLTYIQGADLPDAAIEWRDRNKQVIAFGSVPHTFALRVGEPGQAAVMTKTTGITGADAAPNVTFAWAATQELNTLAAGTYTADLIATRTSDSRQRKLRFELVVLPAVA